MLRVNSLYHMGSDEDSRFRLLYMSPQLCPVQTRLHKREQRRSRRLKRCQVAGGQRGRGLVYTLKCTSLLQQYSNK